MTYPLWRDLSRNELLELLGRIEVRAGRIPDEMILNARWDAAEANKKLAQKEYNEAFNAYSAASDLCEKKWTAKRAADRVRAFDSWKAARVSQMRWDRRAERAWAALKKHWDDADAKRGVA